MAAILGYVRYAPRALVLENSSGRTVRKRGSFAADVFEIPAEPSAVFPTYESLQLALSHLTGGRVHPVVPWLLSFLNGSTITGFSFGRLYPHLPGRAGAIKGLSFGVSCWTVMGLLFFPLLGLGVFATSIGLGLWPAPFSLAMLLTYSVVMGVVYDALNS